MTKTASTFSVAALLFLAGCTSGPRMTLKDINPNRTYKGEYSKVMDAIRVYGAKEAFRIDKFDREGGTVVGYRNYTASPDEVGASRGKVIVMHLSITTASPQETSVNASFRRVEDQGTPTRQDEADLVDCYRSFFDLMDASFPSQ
jgi:hypothetical protein